MQPADASNPPAEPTADRGERARTRLLVEAERLFAEKGYAKASTREICAAAGLNVAAIHYHFGGKEGLYREVLLGPVRELTGQFDGFDDPALSLAEALRRMLGAFVGVAAVAAGACTQDDMRAAQGLRLHLREMVEPSPVYAATVAQHIEPAPPSDGAIAGAPHRPGRARRRRAPPGLRAGGHGA